MANMEIDNNTDIKDIGRQLRLSNRTTDILLENNFVNFGDLKMLSVGDMDSLRLPLRDAAILKKTCFPENHFIISSMSQTDIRNQQTEPGINEKFAQQTPVAVQLKKCTLETKNSESTLSDELSGFDFCVQKLKKQKRTGSGKGHHVLFFGETGCGKSTLINYLANFFLRGTLLNLKIAIPNKYHHSTEHYISTEANIQDSTLSQTWDCSVYEFELEETKFHFIDTPGLSDTAGTEKDADNIEKIMKIAEETGSLSAIVIVINGSMARATTTLRNTLTRIRGSVPDVYLNNLLFVLTNCSNANYTFDLQSLKPWTATEKNTFFMNNSVLSRDIHEWSSNAKILQRMEQQWEDSMEEISNMLCHISDLGHTSTEPFRIMRQKKHEIKKQMNGLLSEIKKLQLAMNELDSTVETRTAVKKSINKTIRSTALSVSCNIFGSAMKAAESSQWENTAAVLEGRFPSVKGLFKQDKTTQDILRDGQVEYKHHSERKDDLKKKVDTLKTEVETLRGTLKMNGDLIKNCCTELKKVCSQFDFATELQSVIDIMEADAQGITSVGARQETDEMVKNLKLLVNELIPDT